MEKNMENEMEAEGKCRDLRKRPDGGSLGGIPRGPRMICWDILGGP